MKNFEVCEALCASFCDFYGSEPTTMAYAPGRIEVLGNHTDYNEGLVLSAAINYGTFFALREVEGDTCRLVAGDVMEEVAFPVDNPGRSDTSVWSNYVRGVWAGMLEHGAEKKAFNAMFLGNIPLGAGLSSSAALEMASGLVFLKHGGISLDTVSLAKVGQHAEHEYAGVKCGLLDQISSLCGKEGCLVKSDFRSLEVGNVPMGDDACFLMCNTNARHALVDGAYNERRQHCEDAVDFFKSVLTHPVSALRDVSWQEWVTHHSKMDELVAMRSAHPIGETERVSVGVELLAKGDLTGFGRLMFDSHNSSREMFQNSCPELDAVVDAAKGIPGVMGARLSGGGFGGSVVVLVHPRDAEIAAKAIEHAYSHSFEIPSDVRLIKCSAGARLIDSIPV